VTERKTQGTNWETWIEAHIHVAMEEGAFDNLPGAGKPLPNFGQEYDPLWWVKQLVQREQISMLSAIARAAPQGGDGTRDDRETPR
jgi:hypothetical protein